MARITEKTDYEAIEPGVYPAELIDYSDTRPDGTPLMSGTRYGDPKPQWRFVFELDLPEEEGRTISAWINKPLSMDAIAPNANLALMAQALMPSIAIGADWELDDLLHKRCRLQVETFAREDGTEGTKIGKYYPLKRDGAEKARKVPTAASVPPF